MSPDHAQPGQDDPGDDPGWGPLGRTLILAIVPQARRSRRIMQEDPLVGLRTLFVGFSNALVLIGVVIAFVRPARSGAVLPWIAVLIVFMIASMIGERAIERPLPCDSEAALAAGYRVRFFLRIVFVQSVALVAFVFTFIGGPWWSYYVGGSFALVRYWQDAAPTRGALARDQDALTSRGCGLSLVRALRDTPPPPRTRRRARGR